MDAIEIFKLFGSIFVDNDEANRSISKTGKEADGLGKKFTNGIKTAGKWALGLGAAAAGVATAAFAMTNKITSGFDNIAKTSTKLGITTDAYQEMEYWANQNGIATSSMERAVGRLNQRMGMAADGNEKYSNALERLGVDLNGVKDGTVTTEDAMATALQTLSEMESETEKSAAAAELFGTRMARDLMPALQDGSMSMDEAKEAAERLGLVIDEDTINAGVSFQDNLTDLKAALGGVTNNIMANLIPAFNAVTDWILDHMPQIQAVFQTVFDVISFAFSVAINWIQTLMSWLIEWRESNSETLSHIWEFIQETFFNIIEFLQETWEFILEFWNEHGEMLLENAVDIFTGIYEAIKWALESAFEIIQNILELVVPYVQETLEFLFEFWSDHGEKIMEAVSNAFEFIKGVIEFIMPVATAIIQGAWDIITSIFDTAIGIITGLIDFFASLLTGDFEGMKDAAIGIWESLWEGLEGLVSGAWGLMSGAFGALWDNISGWFSDLPGMALEWGKGMMDGFVDGIKSMGGKVKEAAAGVTSTIGGWLGFSSPTEEGEGRYIVDWGRNMIDGFLDGVTDGSKNIGNVLDDFVGNMRPVVQADKSDTFTASTQNDDIIKLLHDLIQAVKEHKDVYIGSEKVTDVINHVNAVNASVRRYMD